jgi:hypothetical protein
MGEVEVAARHEAAAEDEALICTIAEALLRRHELNYEEVVTLVF